MDIDECKLNQHSCNRQSEVCDNTVGGFRCLARQQHGSLARSLNFNNDNNNVGFSSDLAVNDNGESQIQSAGAGFSSSRLCPIGMRWDSIDGRCQPVDSNISHRSASLSASSSSSSIRRMSSSSDFHSTSSAR